MINFNDKTPKDEAFRFYTANLDGAIKEAVELLMEKAPQNDIKEEIALYKASMVNRVALYSAALKSGKPEAVDKAAELLQAGLKSVADMVRIQAQLDSLSKDKYTLAQIEDLVNGFVDIVYSICSNSDRLDIAEKIESKLRKHTDIALRSRGVTFDPTDDVLEMDASVPRIAE